jgi:hypothetical protein
MPMNEAKGTASRATATPRASSPESAARDDATDWPALVARAVDDLSRIVQAEIRLAEIRTRATFESGVNYLLGTTVILGLLICAAICTLAAVILLLHQWLDWWLSFEICGVTTLITAIILRFILARQLSSEEPPAS